MLDPGHTLGKYVLRRKLGQGGFGVVFVAEDTTLGRDVALKLLRTEHTASSEVVKRFIQEARSAAKVVHPGIVTVFECGQVQNGSAYIAMELLSGETVTERLARCGRMAPAVVVEIARQVASALDAAHHAGIVHRDLKPDNLFLVCDPAAHGGERVKILDFGIAKLADPTTTSNVQTQSMMVFGTPRYMSPEQCRSAASVDQRSDIYMLGCILYELLAGQPPFDGQPGELIAYHLMVDPAPLLERAPETPRALAELVHQMLAKEPVARPATMADVLQRLMMTGAMDTGAAPTLPPGAISHFAVPAKISSVEKVPPAPPDVTTLSALTGSSIRSAPKRTSWMVYAAAGVAVVVVPLGIVLALRSTPVPQVAAPVAAPPAPAQAPKPAPVATPIPVPSQTPTPAPTPTPKRSVPRKAEPGRLAITMKPACDIVVDGIVMGHGSRELALPAGKHTIVLVDAANKIKDSFVVDIKAGDTQRVNKEYPVQEDSRDQTINPFPQGGQ